tara:strand:- start:3822 stop:4103 length:282 start_codon:yes stop_codon:yes gene_type:complete
MDNFRVICINDSAKPSDYIGQWIKKNEIYTVVDAKKLAKQRMTLGYKFAEIDISEQSPYQFFLSNRFRPVSEDDEMMEEALEELMKDLDEVLV